MYEPSAVVFEPGLVDIPDMGVGKPLLLICISICEIFHESGFKYYFRKILEHDLIISILLFTDEDPLPAIRPFLLPIGFEPEES